MTPGRCTTEFRLTVLLLVLFAGVLLVALWRQSAILATAAIAAKAFTVAAYALCRTLLKILDPLALLERWAARSLSPAPAPTAATPQGKAPMSTVASGLAGLTSVPTATNSLAGLVEKADAHARALLTAALGALAVYAIYKLVKLIDAKAPSLAPIADAIEKGVEAQVATATPAA